MSEIKHTPEVGQIRVNQNNSNRTTYYKITKLSAAMLWYFECDCNGEPFCQSKVYRIWIKNADLFLGEPLETYRAREKAERNEQAKKAMQDSHEKYAEVYKALS